jgi:hypothetical protein
VVGQIIVDDFSVFGRALTIPVSSRETRIVIFLAKANLALLRGVSSQRSGCRSRLTRVATVVAIAVLGVLPQACGARARGDDAVPRATCTRTHYLLTVRPGTTVSNEWHRLEIQGTASTCGRRSPVPGAVVRLGRYRATTDAHGRASLTVRLETGRYVIRLYVHRQPVARIHIWVIPNVAR